MTALLWGGCVYALGGESAKAAALADRALRLSPFDPAAWLAHLTLAHAAVNEDRFDDVVSHFDRAMHLNPQMGAMHAFRAAALALAGRASEAGRSVAKMLELDPSFRWGPIMPLMPALAEKWGRGLRLAGLPE